MEVALSVVTTLVISWFGTPWIRRVAVRLRAFATSNSRTLHKRRVPNLGGVVIVVAFFFGAGALYLLGSRTESFLGLAIGATLIALVGLLDDLYNLSCYQKLAGQTIAALLMVWLGVETEIIFFPFVGPVELGMAGGLFSVLWIVSVTNAINLLDGLDGLASSLTILIATFIALGAIYFNHAEIAVLAAILAAANVGFLRYNLPPARIFMGDTGSLFLGFSLAYLSLEAFKMPGGGVHVPSMLALFLVPLSDTLLAVARRLSRREHPFTPDKKHIHHRLLERGLDHFKAVTVLSAATIMGGLAAIAMLWATSAQAAVCLLVLGSIFLVVFAKLGCFDFIGWRFARRRLSIRPAVSSVDKRFSENVIESEYSDEYSEPQARPAGFGGTHFSKRKLRTPV